MQSKRGDLMKDVEIEFREFYEKTFGKKLEEGSEGIPLYAFKIFCGGYDRGMKDCLEIIENERKK